MPRLKEIINASKSISTPIITAKLVEAQSLASARIVKSQIETTTLGEVAHRIREVPCSSLIGHVFIISVVPSFALGSSWGPELRLRAA